MNLWKLIKVQAALALFVAAAFTQLAHAGVRPDNRSMGPRASESSHSSSMPSQAALDAMGARWNAIADSYGARPASSYYSKQALDAMAQRSQAQVPFDPGALFPNSDPSSPGYVPNADFATRLHTALGELDTYVPGVSDFPASTPEPGPAANGYVVGGQLIQPGVQGQSDLHVAVGPDNRAGIRAVDAYVPGVSDFPASTPESGPAAVTGNGFDWHDAGIGAVGAFGACLLLVGCAVLAASHRRQRLAVL